MFRISICFQYQALRSDNFVLANRELDRLFRYFGSQRLNWVYLINEVIKATCNTIRKLVIHEKAVVL